MPEDRLTDGYLQVPPELVFEVLSPDDRWPKVLAKVAEYLEAGVLLVCVANPKKNSINLFRPDEPDRMLGPDDDWSAPEMLGEFRIPVRRFFE